MSPLEQALIWVGGALALGAILSIIGWKVFFAPIYRSGNRYRDPR